MPKIRMGKVNITGVYLGGTNERYFLGWIIEYRAIPHITWPGRNIWKGLKIGWQPVVCIARICDKMNKYEHIWESPQDMNMELLLGPLKQKSKAK